MDHPRIEIADEVIFSSLGYTLITIPVSKVKLVFNEYPVISMVPTNLELEGVVVSDKANYMVPETVGYSNRGEEVFGYWKDNIAFGGELGTRVVVKKGLRRLDNFIFEVWHNPSDSLLLRVNVYDDDGRLGLPKTNLNKSGKNILYSLTKDERMVSIDLKPYEIFVENDFIISLELLKVYGNEDLGLVVAAVKDISNEKRALQQSAWTRVVDEGHGTFRKYASQGKWERITDLNMAYTVETSRLVDEKEYARFQRKEDKNSERRRYVTGFAIVNGKMVQGVSIFNHSTKETAKTDERGRFSIAANKNDIVSFTKEGYKPRSYKINAKPTLNVRLIPAVN